MDVYGLSTTQDCFRIDDLLDFSNEEIFSASSASTSTSSVNLHHRQHDISPPENPSASTAFFNSSVTTTTDFTDDLCVPSDDVAELEWLSRFVDDSFSDFPSNSLTGGGATLTVRSDTSSFTSKSRTKRSKATNNNWTSSPGSETPATVTPKQKKETHSSPAAAEGGGGGGRRCTHCASEKTPQWRAGPLGPKTLCNACGVRFKSGRLVPEYRPAASPTFVLTQHSNSHRKVLELRRQKELSRHQQQQQQQHEEQQQSDQMQMRMNHHHRRQHDFEVC